MLPTTIAVAGFLLQHALQGWCPPMATFRRLGVRTSYEIDYERYALKVLRRDFDVFRDKSNQGKILLLALRQLRILDTDPEQAFDNLTSLASYICGTPNAAISLVDEDRHGMGNRKSRCSKPSHLRPSFRSQIFGPRFASDP